MSLQTCNCCFFSVNYDLIYHLLCWGSLFSVWLLPLKFITRVLIFFWKYLYFYEYFLVKLISKAQFVWYSMSAICFWFRISNDSSFAKNVGGVLVDARTNMQNKITGNCGFLLTIICVCYGVTVTLHYSQMLLGAKNTLYSDAANC